MANNVGHIKIDRKILEWGWYKDSNMVHLFIHLLLNANHKDITFNNIEIKRGQLLVGRKKLSEITGLTEMNIRTCLNRLKSTNEITIKSTNKYSIITVVKYDVYQSTKEISTNKVTNKSTIQLTNKQPATNQQLTTNNNDNNEKNEKENKEKYNAQGVKFSENGLFVFFACGAKQPLGKDQRALYEMGELKPKHITKGLIN